MAVFSRTRAPLVRVAVALLVLPLLLGCGCCNLPNLIFDEIFGGQRHTFTEQDLIGDWSSDCGGTVSIRADGTATVTDLPVDSVRNDAGDLVENKVNGEFRWQIQPESDDTDQEVRFTTPQHGEEVFAAHAERDWTGFDDLEYYLSTPDEPIYCVLSK
ncbi:hypothetical protein AB0K00_44395 [Dactylosporangium sp. NPDC049525]|uniref:hypothetical protein n=1 Tax=Dactylosporangium sp. NPDC049525 TaxID=3154730 RepID=UPI0034171F09